MDRGSEPGDDFTVRLWKEPQGFLKRNVSGAYGRESSASRDELIQHARLVLNGRQSPTPDPDGPQRGPKAAGEMPKMGGTTPSTISEHQQRGKESIFFGWWSASYTTRTTGT